MKDLTWSTVADCSQQLLRLVAENSKQGIDFETALAVWKQSIRRRRYERMQQDLRLRCLQFPFVITDDVRSLNPIVYPKRRNLRASELVNLDELGEDQSKFELITPGSKRHTPATRDISAKGLAQRKRQKQQQHGVLPENVGD